MVLDRLICRDRSAELLALLGVCGGELGALTGHADGLRGEEHTRQIDQGLPCSGHDGYRRAIERHAGSAPSWIEVRRCLDAYAAGGATDDRNVVADRHHQYIGEPTADNDARVTVRGTVSNLDGTAQRGRADERAISESGQQLCLHVLGSDRRDHRARDHRRHEGSRRDRPAELFDHDDELR
jgi:hypothetical protein